MSRRPPDDGYDSPDEPSEPFEPEPGAKRPRGPSEADVALMILAAHTLVQGPTGLVYRYDSRRWKEIKAATLTAIAHRTDGGARKISRRREIVELVKAMVHDEGLSWGRVEDHEVACWNGVVDALTGQVRPHRAEDFLETVIPWDYEPLDGPLDAAAPLFASCLFDWLGEDAQAIAALQEFFGYVTLSHAKYKKALFAKGPGNTGKSAVVKLLIQMVGVDQQCMLPVDQMDDPVMCHVIKGKRLNVITDLPAHAVVKDGGFKTLVSGEEPILINTKYEDPESYWPTAKHAIASNNFPEINDRTSATIDRLLLIPFVREIPPERRDPKLMERLAPEMKAVLAWAVEGAKRLVERDGTFTHVASAEAILREEREEMNPMANFLAERVVGRAGQAIPLSLLVTKYNAWSGEKRNSRWVGKRVRDAGWRTGQVRDHHGVNKRAVVDADWRPEDQQSEGASFVMERGAEGELGLGPP